MNKTTSLNSTEESPGLSPPHTSQSQHHKPSHPAVNGDTHEVIDDDIHHTVGRLFNIQPARNNLNNVTHNKRESIEEIVSKAIQAERNHWKDRLQLSMQEIDRQHRIILTTQSGLQDLVKSLKHTSRQRKMIIVEEDDERQDIDHEVETTRLIETLKFQVRHLKVRAGVGDMSSTEMEDTKLKQKIIIKDLKERIKKLEDQTDLLEQELSNKSEKVNYLTKENISLHKQCQKLQKIVSKYNESHNGANFHLNTVQKSSVEKPSDNNHSKHDKLTEKRDTSNSKLSEKRSSTSTTISTMDMNECSTGTNTVRERTYLEGDQMVSYPNPNEEAAMIKDRIRRSIYSARKADYRSSNVAQCLRCQTLFKPAENTQRSCRYHHKGREITEQFHGNGRIDKVVYKWACCKKPLEVAGCCYGFHV